MERITKNRGQTTESDKVSRKERDEMERTAESLEAPAASSTGRAERDL